MSVGDAAAVVQAAGVVVGFLALWRSNRRLSASLRMQTLQQMVVEMNRLRSVRASEPALERALFPSRAGWEDAKVKAHLIAVQLANIFEWAYLARRDGLIEREVWDSWVATWRGVILKSDPIRASFDDVV